MTRLLLALLVLLAALAVACGDDDDDASPTGTATSDATGPDDTDAPEDTITPPALDEADPTVVAQLAEEAREHCPEDDLRACADRYIRFALGDEPVALCTNGTGRWFFEAPQGAVGDPCSGDTTIAVIVGGEE